MKAVVWMVVVSACSKELDDRAHADNEEAVITPLSWPVDEPGPFQVGYQSWDHGYDVSESLGERNIRVHLWYPTEDTTGPMGMYTVGSDQNVIAEASMATPAYERGFPVHVHSHGDLDLGTASAFLSRYLASHGWMSIGIDHAGNTLLDLNQEPQAANFFHRPLDVRAALDSVEDHPMVAGRADTSRSILSGHSRGAYTTWVSLGASYDQDSVELMCATGEHLDGAVCSTDELAMFQDDLSDPRVVATIPLDGTIRREWFGASGETSVRGPVLYFSSAESRGSQQQFDELADIDFRWVTIEGACHQSFANGGCNSLDNEEGFQIVSALSLAFARMVVLEDTASRITGLLAGDGSVSDRVSVYQR